jgi:antitoxin MazE
MRVKLAKWGNSLAVRLPKHVADELVLAPGQSIDLHKEGTRLVIETVPNRKLPRYKLEDLVAQMKPADAPPYEDWGILSSEWPVEDWSDIAPSDDEWAAWKQEAEERGALRRRRSP